MNSLSKFFIIFFTVMVIPIFSLSDPGDFKLDRNKSNNCNQNRVTQENDLGIAECLKQDEQENLTILDGFEAYSEEGKVILEWWTSDESNNVGFYLVRSEKTDSGYILLNSEIIPAQGDEDRGHSYIYIDKDVRAGRFYYYWLADLDFEGVYTIHGPVRVELISLADYSFSVIIPWSKPIEGYKSFGEYWSNGELADLYSRGIHDLAPHKGMMWFGYGDADYNLGTKMIGYGRRGIEFRYFASPDDPVPYSSFESGEEQIDQFRWLDGELWNAGIDSNDPNEATSVPLIQGNVYRYDGEQWIKFRTINGGEHVHDVAFWQGTVYAVGSGADDRSEWEGGNIFRYLWGSTTGGISFSTIKRVGHPEQQGRGDTRWIRLLPLENVLYIFGYYSMFAQNRTFVSNALYDGTEIVVFDDENQNEVMTIFAYGTQPLPDGTGLLWGVFVDAEGENYKSLWHLDQNGIPVRLSAFDNENLIDVYFHHKTGEIVYLLRNDVNNKYFAKILLADMKAPGEARELYQYTSDTAQVSIAFWEGKMFLGMDNCQIYRSGNPPRAEFTVTPKTGNVWQTIFYVDASSSSDDQDPAAVLNIRWKWESGTNFTNWTTMKKAQHKYPSAGTKVITLEVRDLDGEISSASREVTLYSEKQDDIKWGE